MRMIDFNSADGLVISNSKSLVVLTDLESLISKIEQRLNFFLGEWLLDTTAGVAYIQQIFKKPVDVGLIVNLLTNEISKEKDVDQVLNASIDYHKNDRSFDFSANINTVYGSSTITTNTVVT